MCQYVQHAESRGKRIESLRAAWPMHGPVSKRILTPVGCETSERLLSSLSYLSSYYENSFKISYLCSYCSLFNRGPSQTSEKESHDQCVMILLQCLSEQSN